MELLLRTGEDHPARVVNENGSSPFLLICEHASNLLPTALNTLGLRSEDLSRHIAYDIGAAGVTETLAKLLNCTAVLQRYSRLAYDCNRPPEAPGAMPEKSEVYDIPGNRNLTPHDKLKRVNEIYRPFINRIAEVIDTRTCHGQHTICVSVHSFTKNYFSKDRDVELGLLFDRDPWLANHLARSFPQFDTRLNEPYGPKDGVMHLMNQVASPRGLKHLMIEIRNDLINNTRGQQEWAQRLSVPLIQAVSNLGV